MASTCRGICDDIRKQFTQKKLGYHTGQKQCFRCGYFLFSEKIRCNCCNAILRTKKHYTKSKKKCLA